MEKYIEEIIEIVLDNVSCYHQAPDEYSTGGRVGSVDYSLDNEQEVIRKAIAALPARLIEKPLVTEKWIEEKALELNNEILLESHIHNYYGVAKNFICLLLNELATKINLKGD